MEETLMAKKSKPKSKRASWRNPTSRARQRMGAGAMAFGTLAAGPVFPGTVIGASLGMAGTSKLMGAASGYLAKHGLRNSRSSGKFEAARGAAGVRNRSKKSLKRMRTAEKILRGTALLTGGVAGGLLGGAAGLAIGGAAAAGGRSLGRKINKSRALRRGRGINPRTLTMRGSSGTGFYL
jgi:hypothetical protein